MSGSSEEIGLFHVQAKTAAKDIYSIPLFCCASTLQFYYFKSIIIDFLSNQLLVSLIATPQYLFCCFTWDRDGMGTTSYKTILIDDGRQSLGGKLCHRRLQFQS